MSATRGITREGLLLQRKPVDAFVTETKPDVRAASSSGGSGSFS